MPDTHAASNVSIPSTLRILGAGLFGLALTIGLVSGLSSSPIVSTLIPVLFTLVTAACSVYVSHTAVADEKLRRAELLEKSRFIGVQLCCFVLGFLIGLSLGIGIRLHSASIWFAQERVQPAYESMNYTDVRALAAALKLDGMMIHSGLGKKDRRAILEELDKSRKARIEYVDKIVISLEKLQSIEANDSLGTLHEVALELSVVERRLSALNESLSRRDGDASTIPEESFAEARNKIASILKSPNVQIIGAVGTTLAELKKYQSLYSEVALLAPDEENAITAVLGIEATKDVYTEELVPSYPPPGIPSYP